MYTPDDVHGPITRRSDWYKEHYIGISHLMARGWTDGQISRFLGGPDRWATNPHRRWQGRGLWLVSRVKGVEESAEFLAEYQEMIARGRSRTARIVKYLIAKERVRVSREAARVERKNASAVGMQFQEGGAQ